MPGCFILRARILCFCICPCESGHNVPITSRKINGILGSANFNFWMNEKCYIFKDQNLENGVSCIFQNVGNVFCFVLFFYEKCIHYATLR